MAVLWWGGVGQSRSHAVDPHRGPEVDESRMATIPEPDTRIRPNFPPPFVLAKCRESFA